MGIEPRKAVSYFVSVSQKFESALAIPLTEMNLSKEVRLACKIDELVEGSPFSFLISSVAKGVPHQSDQQCCEGRPSYTDQQCCEGRPAFF
ncbi:unnamed protein product [Rodentolepis nana]|uniref:Uncharacterized protein n=1 Tax=Rodentolepis nana TaxID=102285 RepID=A0A0R3TZ92_RODNA|nr:unnamed protein product [Rodentolepis nana]